MAIYTWVGTTTDYGTGSNWTGGLLPNVVPTLTDTIVFSNNKPCDTGASNRTCAGVTFSGYTGVLTLQSNLTCNGNLIMQSTQATRTTGTGRLIIGASCTITPNAGNWGSNLQIGNTGTIQVSLASGFNVLGDLTFTGGVNLIGTGGVNLSALGNVVASPSCVVTTSNTAAVTLVISGLTSQWSGTGLLGCNITFQNPAATFTISGNVAFGITPSGLIQTPTLNYVSAAPNGFVTTNSTIEIQGNVLLQLGNTKVNNVTLRAGGTLATITLVDNLKIFGNLLVSGLYTLSRSGSNQVIELEGNLSIGSTGVSASINADLVNGAKIILKGKAGIPSILSGSRQQFGGHFCNVDIDIDAGANEVVLNTNPTFSFNFGNPSVQSPIYAKTLQYLSGTFTATNSTIVFGQTILKIGAQTLNNVTLAVAQEALYTFQLFSDLTMTGNLFTGANFWVTGYGTHNIVNAAGGSATKINIGGGLQVGQAGLNSIGGTIKLNFVGNGLSNTISSTSNSTCQLNIDFTSGIYTIGNFNFGIQGSVNVPTMKYLNGSVSANGMLTSYHAIYDIGSVQINNFQTLLITNYAPTIQIKAANVFRINGNFQNLGVAFINFEATTINAQIDVYGNATIGNYLYGSIKLYMKGTGTLTGGLLGVDTFIENNSLTTGTTIGTLSFGNSKKFEYVSGILTNTNTSIINVGIGTIKSLGQTFCDIGLNGSQLTLIGNLICRDLITAGTGSSSIGGSTFTLSVTRNLFLTGGGTLTPIALNPVNKIIMTGAGTWSGTQSLGIDLDLNASGSTIIVSGEVGFYNSKTLKWYVGTTMSTSGSTLKVGSCILDLGNQEWGSFISNLNSSVILTSNANFNGVTFGNGGGVAGTLSGNSPSLVFKVRSNFTNINASGTLQSGVGLNDVLLSMDGGGTFTSANATTNLSVQLTSGTTTLSGVVNWGGTGTPKSFVRTGGSLASGTSTFNVGASSTISVPSANGSFWNVNMPPTATITLNAQMGILNNLVLSTTAANIITFASSGNFGWDAKNFTHGGGTTTCILNAGSTYNVSGTFQLIGSNDGARATLRSSSLSSFTGTANGTTLTLAAPESNSAIVPNMAISQASGVAPSTFGTLLPTRPTIVSNISPLSWLITPAVTPSVGAIAMQSGLKAFFNLAPVTGVALVLYAITKDINSNGGQTIYAFQTYLDTPSNPTANMFRTLNWNTLAPPVSPISIGFISVT